MSYFSIQNVTVRYDHVLAVSDISIQLEESQIIALIGSNGAGKTSTLRAVTGLTPVVSGDIYFQGNNIKTLGPHQIVEMGIIMVPEGRHVFPYMSVKDNLLMGAFARSNKAEVQRDMDRVYERFPRLAERKRQQAGTMSGGEQQMLVIGRALMAKPSLLLLDEPSLGLAPLLVQEIARSIVSINEEEGVSIILVEQNSRMALRVSDRAYALETGRIALEGESKEMLEDDRVRKLYLGV